MSTARKIIPPPAAPSAGKHIERTPDGDYAAYYEGQLLGFRKRREDAVTLADQHVYDLFTHGQHVTAGELAAGAE